MLVNGIRDLTALREAGFGRECRIGKENDTVRDNRSWGCGILVKGAGIRDQGPVSRNPR